MNGGRDWSTQERCDSENINDIAATPDGFVWAVGRRGSIWRSRDNGTTWQCGEIGFGFVDIADIISRPNGLFFFGSGLVFSSTNGGETWSSPSAKPIGKHFTGPRSIYATSTGREFWAVDGYNEILYSKDGGKNWRAVKLAGLSDTIRHAYARARFNPVAAYGG